MQQQQNDELSWKTSVLQEYINTPQQQSYMNKSVYEPQSIQIIKELCQSQSVLKVSFVGTTICMFCDNNIDNDNSFQNHFCQKSYHNSCFQKFYEEKNPTFSESVLVNCPKCQLEFFPEQVEKSYGGMEKILQKQMDNKSSPCVICQKVIFEKQQEGQYVQHIYCDKLFHKDCIKKAYLTENNNLDPGYEFKCKSCNLEFVIEQIWEVFGGKEKYQQIRNKLDSDFVNNLELEFKQQRSKEARERVFECEICMCEVNINDDCRTLDHCMHQFCTDCLTGHIRSQKNEGKIECPLCKDMPVEERKFPDPTHGKDYVHDPNNIEISMPIIKDLLPKEEFEALEELWTRKFYKTGNDRVVLLQCPGFMKKPIRPYQNEIELIIEQKTHQKMLMGNLKNLGFEFRNCSAMYELDLNEDVNKYRCKACDLEFCPKCKDVGHDKTCEEFKKWKIENEKGDKAMEELLKTDPKTYRKCPKCSAIIMKASGCNRIPCANKKCGAHICWVCMEYFPSSREGYSHIDKKHPGKLWKE